MGEITTSVLHDWTNTHIRDRRTQIVLARLRIGHTYLTQSYLLTRDPPPYCDDCQVPLTCWSSAGAVEIAGFYRHIVAAPDDPRYCGASASPSIANDHLTEGVCASSWLHGLGSLQPGSRTVQQKSRF
ncbi:hypothetical protein E2C01_060424 [Portunus trituberculatus]|uniref:Uncharacterized protein n=1 Tax=Portunus trituberculatus TaxID=210409 RepID=A0A5B7HAG2_PORTR|nr:hypothetical protein [Portunus trituberculatus]